MSIHKITEKFNSALTNDLIFLSILMVSVAVSSFVLGRISVVTTAFERSEATVVLNEPEKLRKEEGRSEEAGVSFVGSVNSDKVHLPWCPGADRITAENEIWFDTLTEAREAGYMPAANCPALETYTIN